MVEMHNTTISMAHFHEKARGLLVEAGVEGLEFVCRPEVVQGALSEIRWELSCQMCVAYKVVN